MKPADGPSILEYDDVSSIINSVMAGETLPNQLSVRVGALAYLAQIDFESHGWKESDIIKLSKKIATDIRMEGQVSLASLRTLNLSFEHLSKRTGSLLTLGSAREKIYASISPFASRSAIQDTEWHRHWVEWELTYADHLTAMNKLETANEVSRPFVRVSNSCKAGSRCPF